MSYDSHRPMMVSMRTVSALDVRKHFGELLDAAASGERIVIERAGQPRAALVSLDDLQALDPAERQARQKTALENIRRMARLRPPAPGFDAAAAVRESRDARERQVAQDLGRKRDRGRS